MRFGGKEAASLLADDAGVIPDYGAPAASRNRSDGIARRWRWRAALCAVSLGGAAWAGFRSASPADGVLAAYSAAARQTTLAWSAANDYTDALGPIGDDYAWTGADVQIVDPYRNFALRLDAPTADTVAWVLSAPDGNVRQRLWGADAAADAVDAVGDYRVVVSTLSPEGYVSGRGGGTLAVRYVRREVRSLATGDRDRWLDALATMWHVGGGDGREAYGSAFISSDELLALHATNSALRDNDHFHNGAGFLAQHLRLDTMVLESLQAIDAAVSSPYWDWTIEAKLVSDGVLASPFDTELWTADMFGSLNFVEDPVVVGPHYGLSTDEFFAKGFKAWAIRDGRWAYSTVKRYPGGEAVPYPTNSFGYLRSPWNNNPSPYVTRVNFAYDLDAVAAGDSIAKTFPSCSNLYDFLTPNATAVDFMTHLEDMTVHANVHQVLGGTIIDVASATAMLDAFAAANSSGQCYQTVSERHLWRLYMSEMRASCDADDVRDVDALRACQLDCGALAFDQQVSMGAWVLDAYRCASDAADYSDVASTVLAGVGLATCRATFLKGEHLEASGTTDPSFFLVHPTLARYYQMKRLMPDFSYVDDWAAADHGAAACEPATGACYVNGIDGPSLETAEKCCAGHFRYSTFFVDTGRTEAANEPTNEQVVAAAHPANPGTDGVVFHHFRFDHCDEDFAAMLAGRYDAAAAAAPVVDPNAPAAAMVHETGMLGGGGGGGGAQMTALKASSTDDADDLQCYPDGATLFPAALQASAGFWTGGKPWGGVLLVDRGQFPQLHSTTQDFGERYDVSAGVSALLADFDGLKADCVDGGDCAFHFKNYCTLEDVNAGQTEGYEGLFVCAEQCVTDRFYEVRDPLVALTPADRRRCADPVLGALFSASDLFKSCLDPTYDCSRGGEAQCPDDCYACVDACVDAHGGELVGVADGGCPIAPGNTKDTNPTKGSEDQKLAKNLQAAQQAAKATQQARQEAQQAEKAAQQAEKAAQQAEKAAARETA